MCACVVEDADDVTFLEVAEDASDAYQQDACCFRGDQGIACTFVDVYFA
ncbi:hypothetical protein Barb4_01079 [Bacteroidales bacterium Barb4]|nr:hypothetical protein Barb4_01079 [Bacteroidales bacterium Barb4]